MKSRTNPIVAPRICMSCSSVNCTFSVSGPVLVFSLHVGGGGESGFRKEVSFLQTPAAYFGTGCACDAAQDVMSTDAAAAAEYISSRTGEREREAKKESEKNTGDVVGENGSAMNFDAGRQSGRRLLCVCATREKFSIYRTFPSPSFLCT